MKLKVSNARKALSFALIFAMMLTMFASYGGIFGGKEDWRAYAADAANAQYSLKDAVYKVYTNSSCTTQATDVAGNLAQFTTDATGNATEELELEEGTYYVKEALSSKGYILDSNTYKVVVNAGETTWVNASGGNKVLETPQSFELKIKKETDDKSWNWPIAGAQFKVTYTDGAQVTRNWIVQTDSNGYANLDDSHFVSGDARYKNSQGKYVVPLGTVTVKEIQSPWGYLINDATKTVTISWGGNKSTSESAVNVTGDINSNKEIVIHDQDTAGRLLNLKKVDTSGDNGWRKLLGAEYTLKYYRVNPDTTTDVTGMTPEKTWTFKTREMGTLLDKAAGIDFQNDEPISGDDFWVEKAKDNGDGTISISNADDAEYMRILPVGVFTIEETKAPPGLARNKTVYYGKVSQDPNGSVATTTVLGTDSMIIIDNGELANAEEPASVVIKIDKKNARTGENAASESETSHSDGRQSAFSTLAGAEYEVYMDSDDAPEPELVGIITVDENGHGELKKRTHGRESHIGLYLPLGNYIIVETKASPGFVIDKYEFKDGSQVEVVDGAIEVICGYDADDNPITKTVEGSREEGKHVFRARMEALNANEFVYTVSSLEEPTRVFVKKTDAATAKELPGATLQIIDKDGNIVEEWVSTNEEHIVYELPTGTYTLREITAPYGYDVAEDIQFTVEENQIVTRCEMQNKPIEVGTTATDSATESHQGTFSEEETIKDVVALKGLTVGRKYKVKGYLYDKKTEAPLEDAEGNVIEAETDEFTADAENMEVELTFTVDSSKFEKDTSVVAFEKLYRTSAVRGEAVPVELAKHEDPDDDDQTINYGGIVGTVATDQDQISKNILAGKDTVIVDKVAYKNLSTKETYKIEGELYDKTTGERTGIKATPVEFKPDKADGEVTVEFKFDSTSYAGHSLVAYEKLFLVKADLEDVPVDEHEDPEDPDQTVEVTDYKMYKVRNEEASAKGKKYGFEPGQTVTYDVVIENISDVASLKLDVSDEFTEKPEYFSLPQVVEVQNAVENSRSSDGNKVNITIKAGETAVVVYETTISLDAKEYLAKLAKDSDSLDADGNDCNKTDRVNKPDEKDGYRNVAKAENPTPFDPDDPDKPYKKLPPKDDDAQTPVKEPEIGTYLADENDAKKIDGSEKTVLVDTVAYKGLTPGNDYAVVGELIVKETGKPVETGEKVKAVGVFTAEEPDGSVNVEFIVNTKGLKGKHLVAFEVAYNITGLDLDEDATAEEIEEDGIKIAEHKDLGDKDQTVYVKNPGTVQTGDMTRFGIVGVFLASTLALLVMVIRRRRALQR